MRVACPTKASCGTTCPYCCSSEWQKRGATQDRLRFVLDCWRPWWCDACCYHFIMCVCGLVFFLLFDAFSAGSNCVLIYIRKVRSRNFPSGGHFPGIIWSESIAGGMVLLVSTLSRGFQVRENSTSQVVDRKLVTGKNAFQVGFKLFQVRGGSGLKSGGSAFGSEKAKKLKG